MGFRTARLPQSGMKRVGSEATYRKRDQATAGIKSVKRSNRRLRLDTKKQDAISLKGSPLDGASHSEAMFSRTHSIRRSTTTYFWYVLCVIQKLPPRR